MKFNDCANTYYPTITEALKDERRSIIYDSKMPLLSSLKERLFDDYDVDGIYLIDSFFDKSIFSINKLSILFEMSKSSLEHFVDAKEINGLVNDFDIFIESDGAIFHYNDGCWKGEHYKINKKELWKN